MNFREWLKIDESRKGPAGGAFGFDKQKMDQMRFNQLTTGSNPGSMTQKRMDNRFQNINDRVRFGKGVEDKIYRNLEGCGLKLRRATIDEDKYDKIDGWWNDGTKEHPIQIKYRDTGDDAVFEVMRDYRRKVMGRDMIGKATFYAILSRDGQLVRIVRTSDAKEIINHMLQQTEYLGFDKTQTYRMKVPGGIAMLRIRPDSASGQEKLMAYIPTSALPTVKECKVNIAA